MPDYSFRNLNTDEIEVHTMRISELDQFKLDNPHLERYFYPDSFPGLGDGMRMSTPGVGKSDSTFEKYVINRIKETVPNNTLARSHKTKSPSEF